MIFNNLCFEGSIGFHLFVFVKSKGGGMGGQEAKNDIKN